MRESTPAGPTTAHTTTAHSTTVPAGNSRTVPGATSTAAPAVGPEPEGSVVVAAAGDIACSPGQPVADGLCRMEATAAVVEGVRPAVVLTLGDNQYEDGGLAAYEQSYDASWGRFKALTHPTAGNHEFAGGQAPGYFGYFGTAAGPPGQGWYSFDAGGWHLVALNSNCAAVGGCGPGSPQHEWLRADLAASPARCTLAYWHHPRYSSGFHGDDISVGPLWELLDGRGAELVLSGHDHHYERFAPLAPDGSTDPDGIRQFVVGTGGRSLYPTLGAHEGSQVRRSTSFGVLVLTLSPGAYTWRFAATAGDDFADAGQGDCH